MRFKRQATQSETTDLRISRTWQDFPNYFTIKYDVSLSVDDNVEKAIEKIVEKMKPFLPGDAVYCQKKEISS